MNLPNYFLADLPPEAELTPAIVREAAQTLRRNQAQYLASRSTASMIELLVHVGRQWLEPNYTFRKLALDEGPAATGFSRATLTRGMESFFRQMTHENFEALLEQDLGNTRRLEELSSNPAERGTQRASLATAPSFIVHIAPGNIPSPGLHSLTLGVLLRSAQLLKCSSLPGAALLPRLFAHSLYDADSKLGSCLEIAQWRGGRAELEQAVCAEADCVTVTGSDEALESIRKLVPSSARFVAYGQRLSFGFIAAPALTAANASNLVTAVANDVTAWNQLGCLSPHVIYAESGGQLSPERFAELLALELERREKAEPRGELPVEVAAAVASRRSLYEVRAAHSEETRLWQSEKSTAWTVVFEADPRFQISCLNRFIYVKSVADLGDALKNADNVRHKVSTVGLAAPGERAEVLAKELARWGATRVCPLGKMQEPPLAWRHDGRPALGELIRWTDYET